MGLNRTLWLEDRSGGCAADVEVLSFSNMQRVEGLALRLSSGAQLRDSWRS